MRQMNVKNEIKIDIPAEVGTLIDELNTAGFEAFAVGGCVRDSIIKAAVLAAEGVALYGNRFKAPQHLAEIPRPSSTRSP